MKLNNNKKKSGVVVFSSRTAHKIPFLKKDKGYNEWISQGNNIDDIPIVNRYKYLETYLDSRDAFFIFFSSIKFGVGILLALRRKIFFWSLRQWRRSPGVATPVARHSNSWSFIYFINYASNYLQMYIYFFNIYICN